MARTRYRYDETLKALVEISDDWTDAETRAPVITEGIAYDGARGPNGEDLSSRKRHREFVRASGLAVASDYSAETLQKNAERRTSREPERRELRETVGRTLCQLQTQRRRR